MDNKERMAFAEGLLQAIEATQTIISRAEVAETWLRGFELAVAAECKATPVPMRITCPDCRALHIDEGEFATKVHHTHSCQACGLTWRPAVVPTVGVRFLPGFKNEEKANG